MIISILERSPFPAEGMIIAGTIGSDEGYIYCRRVSVGYKTFKTAIAQAEE